ncbi:MAG: hypothetical protein HRT44_00670 [Bdellovibrionales bacterium]|nr:hypothetical protein [Bdellovibrionales bacterium]
MINKLAFLFTFIFCLQAQAKDWVMLQGTEPNAEIKQRRMLFLQPQFAHTDGTPLAAGPFQGQKGIFNLNGPEFRDESALQIIRAFAMARGNMPGTEGKINYFGMLDFGENLKTGSERSVESPTNLQLADLSVTFNYIPFARLRLGQFLAPDSNETMKAIHVYDYVNYTNFTIFTMLDWNMPSSGDGTTANRPNHSNAGFRDIGLMLFDQFNLGSTSHTYSIMLGNGNGISRWENDDNMDIHMRYRFGWDWSKTCHMEWVLWGVNGGRNMIHNGRTQTFKRQRLGTDLELKLANWRIDVGLAEADGIIFHGTFGAGQPGISNGTQIASFLTLPEENATGYYAGFNYDLMKQYTFGMRYDQINYGKRVSANERIFDTFTLSTQYKFKPTSPTRLMLNYEFRNAEAPNLADTSPINQFLAGVDDRVSLSLFWFL